MIKVYVDVGILTKRKMLLEKTQISFNISDSFVKYSRYFPAHAHAANYKNKYIE